MRVAHLTLSAALTASLVFAAMLASRSSADTEQASPMFGVTIPKDYRQWELIAPAQEGDPFDELRAVLGNAVAIKAYREGTLPFPDGTVLAKLAWKRVRLQAWGRDRGSVHGQGFEKIRVHRRLGIRQVRRW
jgi:hypothetical protein